MGSALIRTYLAYLPVHIFLTLTHFTRFLRFFLIVDFFNVYLFEYQLMVNNPINVIYAFNSLCCHGVSMFIRGPIFRQQTKQF